MTRRRAVMWVVLLVAVALAAAAGWYHRYGGRSGDHPGRDDPGVAAAGRATGESGPARGDRSPARSGGGGGGGGADGARRADARPQPVAVATAAVEPIDVTLSAIGTIVPRVSVVVRPRVDGQLMRVNFQEGQIVRAGQVLAEIDPRPFQVQLSQAQGQLARDRALLQNARVDLARYRTLLAQDSIARQQVDTQEATVRQYEGIVAADQGAVDAARLQLSFVRIQSPLTGRIGLRQVDPGNMVHASDTNGLATVAQVDPITALFAIPEADAGRLMARLGQPEPLPVDLLDRDGQALLASGRVLTADNQIDPATGTLKVRAIVPNPAGTLVPNQFVNVRVRLGRATDLPVVPAAAVQRGAQGTFVWRVRGDDTVAAQPVVTGAATPERVAIAQGLQAGDRVVTDGVDRLRDGTRIQPLDPIARARPELAGRADPAGSGSGGPTATTLAR